MKIGLIHSFYSSTHSGENTVVINQLEALRQMGHEVSEIFRHSPQNTSLPLKFKMGLMTATNFDFELSEKLLETFDLIIVHNIFPNFGLNPILKSKKPVIRFWHNFRFTCAAAILTRNGTECKLCLDGTPINALIHRCYRNSFLSTLPLVISQIKGANTSKNSRVTHIALTQEMKTILIQAGVSTDKIIVVPNYLPTLHSPIESVSRTGFFAAGRLVHEKGFAELLQNWPDRLPIRIAGDGPERSEIFNFSKHRPNIEYLGALDNAAMMSEMSKSRIGVIPSKWREGTPLVALEMLSLGLPIITLEGNSVSKMIQDFGVGSIIKNLTSEEILNAIASIETDYEGYSSRSLGTFAEQFGQSRWQDSMTEVIRSIMN